MNGRSYIAIDLKSFYASVECVERGLDPLGVNLVVADPTRTEKTICLAVTPALKAYGISGRARLFEVVRQVEAINDERRRKAPGHVLKGSSYHDRMLKGNPSLALDYIVAPPRMARYMEVSGKIFGIYLKYIAPEDIQVYSIDEVFIDATSYLKSYACSARELAMRMIKDVLSNTGITATAGIGANLYLAKIAMDIEAKHSPADEDGVRIAELDEMSYRMKYWDHRPITDFWRVGRGLASRLESNYMYTMGDIARCSIRNEELLYRLFGVNAELLIDHAWGWEPCTMKDIKSYRPSAGSISRGQVLSAPYDYSKARTVVKEMTDMLVMELVERKCVTDRIDLTVGYDAGNLSEKDGKERYEGPVARDYYGREVPKPAHASTRLGRRTSSTKFITDAMMGLFDRNVDPRLMVRRIYVVLQNLIPEDSMNGIQMNLFDDDAEMSKERRQQEAIISIRKKFGKNAILKGMNFEEGATARERNSQIGGHKA